MPVAGLQLEYGHVPLQVRLFTARAPVCVEPATEQCATPEEATLVEHPVREHVSVASIARGEEFVPTDVLPVGLRGQSHGHCAFAPPHRCEVPDSMVLAICAHGLVSNLCLSQMASPPS